MRISRLKFTMIVQDLGVMAYRDAWSLQERVHAEVADGAYERLLLVEHPPVITFGRRPNVNRNLIASDDQLAKLGVELVQSDRGGDITFHGPGQLVAYPIVRLNDHKLSVGGYVRRLEETVIATLLDLGIPAQKDTCAIGVWSPIPEAQPELCHPERSEGSRSRVDANIPRCARDDSPGGNESSNTHLAKICALGVRIRRGVSMHGIALNVTTDLRYFDLIVPCGLTGRAVTSIQQLFGDSAPTMEAVKSLLAHHFCSAFTSSLATSAPAARQ